MNVLIERTFGAEDLKNLLDLLKTCHNGWHDDRYWAWKYQKNPHGSPIIWVAEDKGRIIGCYILNPVKLRIGEFTVQAAQAVDAAVHPDYRGAGVFKKLASNAVNQASRDGIAIIYAFPTEFAYKGQLRIGYSPVFLLPRVLKVFRARSLLEKTEPKNFFFRSAKFASVLFPNRPLKKPDTKHSENLELKKVEHLDMRYETFWREACSENKAILVERDAAYMQWRYNEHPENQYEYYVCEKDGEIVGFTVLSVERNVSMNRGEVGKFVVGNIVDLLALQNDMNNVVSALISVACNYFRNENVDIASCWIPKCHAYRPILQKFGFYDYDLLRRAVFGPKYDAYFICYLSSRTRIARALEYLPKKTKPCWLVMQGDADYM